MASRNTVHEILFVSHTAQEGGAELALRRYVESGPALPVRIVTLEGGPIWSALAEAGASVTVLGEVGDSQLTRVLALARFLRTGPRPLIVGNSMRAAFYCALVAPRGSRLLYWVRDGLTDSAMNWLNVLLTRLVTLPRSRGCIANSEWTAVTVRQVSPGKPVEVAHSPAGITAVVDPEPRERPVDGATVKLLFLGRLAPWKGPHLAIEALKRMTDARASAAGRSGTSERPSYSLTLAGGPLFDEEDYFAELKDLVVDLGLSDRVEFLGHVSDVSALFRTHDVLLHCSTVPEPFGQVVVQAMGHGLPVIAADAGGPREIIESPVDGILYEMGSVDALVSAVDRLFDGSTSYESISIAAELTARGFTDEECAREIDRAVLTLGGLTTVSQGGAAR